MLPPRGLLCFGLITSYFILSCIALLPKTVQSSEFSRHGIRQTYQAKFHPHEANGLKGTFKFYYNYTRCGAKLNQASASLIPGKYAIRLDFSDVNKANLPANCSLANITYHIHTQWKLGDVKSAAGATACGKNVTGLHYDKDKACGPVSEYYNTTECPANQTYSCNGNYSAYLKNNSICELGDLSGKNGALHFPPKSPPAWYGPKEVVTDSFVDPDPPQLADYQAGRWASLVIHCAGNQRAFCAKIEAT